MFFRYLKQLSVIWGLLLILACGTPPPPGRSGEPLQVTPTPGQPTPTLALPAPTNGAWQTLRPGFEQRLVEAPIAGAAGVSEEIVMIRLDPTLFRLAVGYRPGDPQTLSRWRQESGAIALINGGFFTPEWLATGLIIADGQSFGQSYGPQAGMVAIQNGMPTIRSLTRAPYNPNEMLEGGLQSFPVLLLDGQPLVNDPRDTATARRSVIGQDRSGRIILLATRRGFFTLSALSGYLATADLDLEIALNLDGGSSTGLIWQAAEGEPYVGLRPLTPLPAVLLVYPRKNQ